jgi:tetratricopeptide (TPR) repeat protein
VSPAFAAALVQGLAAYDANDMLSPAMTAAALALAGGRGSAAAGALKEARAGAYSAAAMTALGDGDQVLAAFLKGLDLLGQGQPSRAAIQFQTAMTQAPQFTPARIYLGAALAADNRHREAAGLLQSGAGAEVPAVVSRLAGEEWLRAGEFDLAIAPLEAAAGRPDVERQATRALGIAYVLTQRPDEAIPILTPYLAEHATDQAALLAGLYAIYARHVGTPQASLAADRTLAHTWFNAYRTAGGTLPLARAWIAHLDAIR